MTDDPTCVKSLKAYAKSTVTVEEVAEFSKHLGSESDRACVIILSAQLEDALQQELTKKMVKFSDKKAFERMFSFDGPLGTFGSKIDMACAMGIIEEEVRGQLHLVREMRNACAHTQRPISFATTQLWNVTRRLFADKLSVVQAIEGRLDYENREHRRSGFILEVVWLVTVIMTGTRRDALAVWGRFAKDQRRALRDTPQPQSSPNDHPDQTARASPPPPPPSRASRRSDRKGKRRSPSDPKTTSGS